MQENERIEIDLFLEAIFRRYGYDFRHYARASVRRRLERLMMRSGAASIVELIPLVLHDELFAQTAIYEFSITVTEMFRDPDFYSAVRSKVLPYLATYPFMRIWIAGCATGEEVYSLAIILQEEGVYDRTTFFATDFNDQALQQAQDGIYPLNSIRDYTPNYQLAGGRNSFADYYHAGYQSAVMDPGLKAHITFANHNLVTDGVFGEMHLILCRNVLIYFDKELKNRVLHLLHDSLVYGGFLCLGTRESLQFTEVQEAFKPFDIKQRVYQKQNR
ncbi:MAG: protein-glutamate O-methyltransferase CheR [Anaerolineae bacterium]|nr:protein-glutamate O-methyltransferase CheR [Anaerolineae bacterium]